MSRARRELERRLRRFTPPEPAADLAERVLAHATAAIPPRPSRIDLLWYSRPLRWGFAAALALLLAIQVAVNRQLEHGRSAPAAAPRLDELAEELGLRAPLGSAAAASAGRPAPSLRAVELADS